MPRERLKVLMSPGREGFATFLILEYHPRDKNSDSLKKQRNWSLGFIHWEIVSNAENKSHCHFISLINWEKGKAYGLCQDQNSINSPLSEKSKLVLGKTVSSAGESWLMIKTRDFRLAGWLWKRWWRWKIFSFISTVVASIDSRHFKKIFVFNRFLGVQVTSVLKCIGKCWEGVFPFWTRNQKRKKESIYLHKILGQMESWIT